MPEKETLSKLLKLHRTNPPKTQAELAADIQLCRKQLSSLELQTANPSYATLKKIADYSGLTLPQLLWTKNRGPCPPHADGPPEAALAQRIKKFRAANKISQEKFAALIETSVSQLSRMERGLTVPCLDTLQTIARCMGISVSELLTPISEEGDA